MNLSLLTDFYELTMMQGYFFNKSDEEVVFDYFIRNNPFNNGYTVFAGLEPLLENIEKIDFTTEEIQYLKSTDVFKDKFLDYLQNFEFKGDIYSVKEGDVVFPNEPLVRVKGKIVEVQLIESLLLNFLNFQSLIATKTARIVQAAGDDPVLEFGLRRAQGKDGALSGARASYIGGVSSTSNTLAGKIYSIPISGTMAHSWIMSFDSELEAFQKYAEVYPETCVLLVDTYDTLKSGVPNAIKVFQDLQEKGIEDFGIRLDSGDLEYLSKQARKMLDENGCEKAKIYASSELDENIIEELREKNSPIDAWGVGTKLITANPDPALSGVYKLVSKNGTDNYEPVIKVSNNPEKITTPGIKNIMRFFGSDGIMKADLIYEETEEEKLEQRIKNQDRITFHHPSIQYAHFEMTNYTGAEKLLQPVMENGEIIANQNNLDKIQQYCKERKNSLHSTHKRFLNPHAYKVSLTTNLNKLKTNLIDKYRQNSTF